MKQLKRWFQSSAAGLLSMLLMGTLTLAVPMKAEAFWGHVLHTMTQAYQAPHESYRQLDCSGEPLAIGDPLTVWRQNPYPLSYRDDEGECHNSAFRLQSEAETQWLACETIVRTQAVIALASVTVIVPGLAPQVMASVYFRGTFVVAGTFAVWDAYNEFQILRAATGVVCGARP